MSELDTIDFLCSSCSCKLQVPAAMAGVSGPCPNCNSSITAPLPAAAPTPAPTISAAPSAEIGTLPPKRLPEHIPATTIRATAHLIRQSAQADEPVAVENQKSSVVALYWRLLLQSSAMRAFGQADHVYSDLLFLPLLPQLPASLHWRFCT